MVSTEMPALELLWLKSCVKLKLVLHVKQRGTRERSRERCPRPHIG